MLVVAAGGDLGRYFEGRRLALHIHGRRSSGPEKKGSGFVGGVLGGENVGLKATPAVWGKREAIVGNLFLLRHGDEWSAAAKSDCDSRLSIINLGGGEKNLAESLAGGSAFINSTSAPSRPNPRYPCQKQVRTRMAQQPTRRKQQHLNTTSIIRLKIE